MNITHKYMFAVAVILIVAPVVQSSMSGVIGASDWLYRHSVWIDRYLRGDFTPIFEYQPLFHWLLAPFVAVGFPMIWLQVVFISLATLSIFYLVYKLEGTNVLLFVAVMLATSIAFVAGASQLMPQSLDYVLFPIAILFYYQKRVKLMSATLFSIFAMHGTGLIFMLALTAHALITKRFELFKVLLLLVVVTTPLFYYYQFVAPARYPEMLPAWDVEAQTTWEAKYIDPWWKFFAYSSFLTWILLPYASYKLYRRKFILTDIQKLYIVWTLAFTSIGLVNYGVWRMVSYSIIPLTLFVAGVLSEKNAS